MEDRGFSTHIRPLTIKPSLISPLPSPGVVRRIIEFVRLGRATVSLHLSFSEFAKIEVHTKSSTDGHFTLVRSTSSNSSPRQAR